MSPSATFIFYYLPTSSYALNVLLGALEGAGLDQIARIKLVRRQRELHETIAAERAEGRIVYVVWSFFSATFGMAARHLDEVHQDGVVINIAGGVHASAEPLQTLQAGFDFVATGEGEETIIAIVRAGLEGRALRGLAGLNWLEDGAMRSGPPAARVALDDHPPFANRTGRINPIEITRGCIYACRFCQTPFMFKARFRHRSIENIATYVAAMRARNMRDLRFISPTALSYGSDDESVNLDAIETLLARCREIMGEERHVFFGSFPSEMRPEHVSPEALALIRKYCNNDNIVIGAQSGSDRVLAEARRGHGTEAVERAVRYVIEAGYIAYVDFIFGLPGETEDDAMLSIAFAERLAGLGADIHAHTFMPLPGTPFRDAPAGRLSPALQKTMRRLIGKGELFGQWEKQIAIAEERAAQQAAARAGRKRIAGVAYLPSSSQVSISQREME